MRAFGLVRRHGFRMSASWLGLVLLLAAWLVQLPVVHQLHLVFDHTEHVWCPVHHRLEHWNQSHRAKLEKDLADSSAGLHVDSADSKAKHEACPLSLMHQSLKPFGQAITDQQVPCRTTTVSGNYLICSKDVLSYSPKLSPPKA